MNDKQVGSEGMMAQHFANVTRRRFLRGLGACMALPALESVRPLTLLATEPGKIAVAAAPRRMAG